MNHGRLAEARNLYAYRRAELERTQASALRAELDASPTVSLPIIPAGGDAMQLRGIPVVGGGAGGAIPGTSPHGVWIEFA